MNKELAKNPIIREQTLEYIARHFGDYGSGTLLISLLKSWNVPENIIEYPNTKWKMVFSILKHYAWSTEKDDHEMLYKIIGEMLHPLMYNGSRVEAQKVANDFAKFLDYDHVTVTYSEDDKRYYVYNENDAKLEEDEINFLFNEEFFQQEYSELEFLRRPENVVKISTLRKTYQTFINIVFVFCGNPYAPSNKMNDAYIKCKDTILKICNDLGLLSNKKIHRLSTHPLPFTTLFNAEKHFIQNSKTLSWDTVRPDMYATYSDIEEIYRKVNGADTLIEPDTQKFLNEITLVISEVKEENKKRREQRQKAQASALPVHQIAITSMPELNIKNSDENTLTKNRKKIALPKFNHTDWNKAEIRFIDEQTVYITADKKTATSDYEALGFKNEKNNKPNTAWKFLLDLAKNGGETEVIKSPIPDVVRQNKLKLSDRLKSIFKNDTDPFYEFADTKTYKIKLKLIPPVVPKTDTLGIREYLDETMTME